MEPDGNDSFFFKTVFRLKICTLLIFTENLKMKLAEIQI